MQKTSISPVSSVLDAMRFQPEKQALDAFMDRFGLDGILRHFEESGGLSNLRDRLLGNSLKLSPMLSPRLFGLLDEVTAALGFAEPVELFVTESAGINALAMHALGEEPHLIVLTSALVERMTDDELRFVLGHEIGHLHYDHYRARLIPHAVGKDDDGDSRVPSLLQRRLDIWGRLTELSADRAGFAATRGDLAPIVSVFFKLASGLGPEHLRFDINAFLLQLEEIKNLTHREVICGFSHPVTPIRVRVLQLFAEAGGRAMDPAALPTLDAQVTELAKLMDLAPTKPLAVHSRDFLAAGGVLVAHADGDGFRDEELNLLVEMLLPLCADPEEVLGAIETQAQARAMLETSTNWLRENAGEERFMLLRYLMLVASSDGRLHPSEEELLTDLGVQLGIPANVARKEMYQILATKLQTQATSAPSHASKLRA